MLVALSATLIETIYSSGLFRTPNASQLLRIPLLLSLFFAVVLIVCLRCLLKQCGMCQKRIDTRGSHETCTPVHNKAPLDRCGKCNNEFRHSASLKQFLKAIYHDERRTALQIIDSEPLCTEEDAAMLFRLTVATIIKSADCSPRSAVYIVESLLAKINAFFPELLGRIGGCEAHKCSIFNRRELLPIFDKYNLNGDLTNNSGDKNAEFIDFKRFQRLFHSMTILSEFVCPDESKVNLQFDVKQCTEMLGAKSMLISTIVLKEIDIIENDSSIKTKEFIKNNIEEKFKEIFRENPTIETILISKETMNKLRRHKIELSEHNCFLKDGETKCLQRIEYFPEIDIRKARISDIDDIKRIMGSDCICGNFSSLLNDLEAYFESQSTERLLYLYVIMERMSNSEKYVTFQSILFSLKYLNKTRSDAVGFICIDCDQRDVSNNADLKYFAIEDKYKIR
ncbi:MAG: hypothetical protein MHMPM18_000483 [Marteilia pararefringens]